MDRNYQKKFGALLQLLMCCDPWPVERIVGVMRWEDSENKELVHELANDIARAHGYADWIDAYHGISA